MEIVSKKILSQINHQEDKLSSQIVQTADEAYQMPPLSERNAV